MLFYTFTPNINCGSLVQGYDSRLGCERSRVQIPEEPIIFFLINILVYLGEKRQFLTVSRVNQGLLGLAIDPCATLVRRGSKEVLAPPQILLKRALMNINLLLDVIPLLRKNKSPWIQHPIGNFGYFGSTGCRVFKRGVQKQKDFAKENY